MTDIGMTFSMTSIPIGIGVNSINSVRFLSQAGYESFLSSHISSSR